MGQSSCYMCSAGRAAGPGQRTCDYCYARDDYRDGTDPRRYYSTEGSLRCESCRAESYWDGGGCEACPKGFDCSEGPYNELETVMVHAGFYRFTNTSVDAYECPLATCLRTNRSSSPLDQCMEGSEGPLCAVCSPGYTLDRGSLACTSCADAQVMSISLSASNQGSTWAVLGAGLLGVGLMASWVLRLGRRLRVWARNPRNAELLSLVAFQVSTIVVTMQTVLILNENHLLAGGGNFGALRGFLGDSASCPLTPCP